MNEPIAVDPNAGHRSFRLPLTQSRLARRATDGDPRAFEAIYERHSQELYRYCLAILRRPEDAQDALQSTMANALRSLPGEGREISLRPWLFRVAHNESITILRGRRTEVDPEEVLELSAPGADTTAADRERLRSLVADLGSLPERQRSAIVLQELSGLSHEEVAAALEMSPGAARQAVYEARSALSEIKEGREMECEQARKTISARDGRMLRGRKLKAHMRDCDGCQDFAAAIGQRRADFAALFPPLPAAAAASVLAAVTGGAVTSGGGAATGAGGLAGAGGLGAISAKGAAMVAAVAVAGVGAAGYSGAVDIPLPGKSGGGSESSENAAATSPAADHAASRTADGSHRRDAGAEGGNRDRNGNNGSGHRNGDGNSNAGGNGNGVTNSNAGGNGNGGASSYTPGTGGTTPPGQGGTPPGQATGGSSGSGGSSSSSPGQGGTVPPGQGGTAPGQVDKPSK